MGALDEVRVLRPLPLSIVPARRERTVDELRTRDRGWTRWLIAAFCAAAFVAGFGTGATVENLWCRTHRCEEAPRRGNHRHDGRRTPYPAVAR
jgi:hypothetical protein